MFSLLAKRIAVRPAAVTSAFVPFQQTTPQQNIFTREFSHKTHQATKKRFKTRGSGAVVFKPSGRQHGMSRHGRSRNQDKGRSVVISRGEAGDLWKRVQGLNVDVAGGLRTRSSIPKSSTYFAFNPALRDSQSPIALKKQAEFKEKVEAAAVAAGPEKELRGFQKPTPAGKKQWRLVKKEEEANQ